MSKQDLEPLTILDAQIHGAESALPLPEHWSAEEKYIAAADGAVAALDVVGVSGALLQWWRPATECYIARHPDRFAGVPFFGWPEPEPTDQREFVDRLAEQQGMVGSRLLLTANPSDERVARLQAGGFDDYLRASAAHGLPVFVLAHGALPALHEVLRDHPDLKVIIDHLGLRPHAAHMHGVDPFANLDEVLGLAQFPNVALKLTGAPGLSRESYPFSDLWPSLHRLFDGFGADRVMWGSDYTQTHGSYTYRESLDYVLLSSELSDPEKTALLGGSLRSWVGWPGISS